MKLIHNLSCSVTLTLVLSISRIVNARPHTHGIIGNFRRLIHPLRANFTHSCVQTAVSAKYGQVLPSETIPTLPSGSSHIPIAGLTQPNVTESTPFNLVDDDPRSMALGLLSQNGPQPLHHDAHPMGQHHGSHHKRFTRSSTTATSATLGSKATRATRAARQVQTVSSNPNDGAYQSWVLGGFSSPTSTSASATSSQSTSLCPDHNGTVFKSSSGITYQIVCGFNYGNDSNNIQPSLSVDSFEGCIQKCDAYNYDTHGVHCVAALYTPAHFYTQPDCFLRSSIAESVYYGSANLINAVRYSVAQSANLTASATSSASVTSRTNSPSATSSRLSSSSQTSSAAPSSASGSVSPPGVTYGSGNSVIIPKVAGSKLHGPSENHPTSQYIQYDSADGITLSSSLLRVGVNGDLSTGYDLSPQTGALEVNIYTQNALAPLQNTPHLSRDGGRGGYVNGQHLFLFCDTGSYSSTTFAQNGNFLDFVSSSVAVDIGMNALSGNPIHLQDGIGEWSDNVGRQRGFAPLTQGEQAYNIAMQGNGQRYAIWIESSVIPLDAETGLVYAPIVYDNVNMITRAAVFNYTGNTILTITAGGRGGPVAQRPVRKLFDQDEPEWGVAGGLRSWGPSGIGGRDGKVYLFGGVSGGMLMARVAADSIENRDAYEYWTGSSWSTVMPSTTSKAFFIEGPLMDIDVFYSPRHLTFIAVYLTIYADSTFYYRYLKADHPIIPSYAPGGEANSDCVENLLKYEWSDEQVLYKASPGLGGSFIYSGGIHTRYFGADDIANGGSRMLLSWTAPTGQNPASATSEYQIVTAEVDFA